MNFEFCSWGMSGLGTALWLAALTTVHSQVPAKRLLGQLQGEWKMTGTVMSKPVEYIADGRFVLNDQFLAFHMKDASVPPAYEAILYIGVDTAKNEYVAHWIDTFGGAGARVVGTGPSSDKEIRIVYPYSEGRFRNLLLPDSLGAQWSLSIESEESDGQWSLFAHYRIVRRE